MTSTTATVLAIITLLAGLVLAHTDGAHSTALSLRPRQHPVVTPPAEAQTAKLVPCAPAASGATAAATEAK